MTHYPKKLTAKAHYQNEKKIENKCYIENMISMKQGFHHNISNTFAVCLNDSRHLLLIASGNPTLEISHCSTQFRITHTIHFTHTSVLHLSSSPSTIQLILILSSTLKLFPRSTIHPKRANLN